MIILKLILILIVRMYFLFLNFRHCFLLKAIHRSNSFNGIMILTIVISFLLLIIFTFLFLRYCGKLIDCYYPIWFSFCFFLFKFSVFNQNIYGKLKRKYNLNGVISDKELEHLRSLTYCNTLKDNILYTWKYVYNRVYKNNFLYIRII